MQASAKVGDADAARKRAAMGGARSEGAGGVGVGAGRREREAKAQPDASWIPRSRADVALQLRVSKSTAFPPPPPPPPPPAPPPSSTGTDHTSSQRTSRLASLGAEPPPALAPQTSLRALRSSATSERTTRVGRASEDLGSSMKLPLIKLSRASLLRFADEVDDPQQQAAMRAFPRPSKESWEAERRDTWEARRLAAEVDRHSWPFLLPDGGVDDGARGDASSDSAASAATMATRTIQRAAAAARAKAYSEAEASPRASLLSPHARACEARRAVAAAAAAAEAAEAAARGDGLPRFRTPRLDVSSFVSPAASPLTPKRPARPAFPDEDTETELHDAMYGMVTWTEDELDYRERSTCFCLEELDEDARVTFSQALKKCLESSHLQSFLKYLNKKGLNTHDVNVNRLDMLTVSMADTLFRELADRLAEKRPSEESRKSSEKASGKSSRKGSRKRSRKRSRKSSRKGSKKRSKSKGSKATALSKRRSRPSKKPSRTSERTSKVSGKSSKRSRKSSGSGSRKGSRKKSSRRSRGKRTRASRESREKTKRSYSEEEEGEGEEDTRIRWDDVPKLGHMLFPLLRPSPLTPLTRDTAAQQFVVCEDMLPLLHRMIQEDVPVTRKNLQPRLRRLRLVNCDMTEVDEGLRRLAALVVLSLAFNWLKEVRGAVLPRGLKFLELHGNALADVHALCHDLPQCLLYLGLGRNRLSDASNLQLLSASAATQLRSLDLGDNDIAQLLAVLEALRGLRHLLALRLHGNPCSTALSYRELTLETLPRLKYLDDVRVWPPDRCVWGGGDGAGAGAGALGAAPSVGVSAAPSVAASAAPSVAASVAPSVAPSAAASAAASVAHSAGSSRATAAAHKERRSPARSDAAPAVAKASRKDGARSEAKVDKAPPDKQRLFASRSLSDALQAATRGALVASVLRIMGLPEPPEEEFNGRKVQHLFTVELELPLLDPVLRQPPVEPQTPSLPPPTRRMHTARPRSRQVPPAPPSTPAGLHGRGDDADDADNAPAVDVEPRDSVPLSKKGKRKKSEQRSSSTIKKTKEVKGRASKGRKSKGRKSKGRKSKGRRSKGRKTPAPSEFFDSEEDYMYDPPRGFEGVADPPEKERILTRFSTQPATWKPMIQLHNEPVRVEAPAADLTALRDTLRSCPDVRLMYTRILSRARPSKKKSVKEKRKKSPKKSKSKSVRKSRKKSKKSAAKSLKKGTSTESGISVKEVPSVSALRTLGGPSVLEGRGSLLSRSTLARFAVPLRQPLWSDGPAEYTWSIDDGDMARPATQSLKDIKFEAAGARKSRGASKASRSGKRGSGKGRKKSKARGGAGRSPPASSGRSRSKGSSSGRSGRSRSKASTTSTSRSRTRSTRSASSRRSRKSRSSRRSRRSRDSRAKPTIQPMPNVPTVHLAFSLERFSQAVESAPKLEHDEWALREVTPERGGNMFSPRPAVPPPSPAWPQSPDDILSRAAMADAVIN